MELSCRMDSHAVDRRIELPLYQIQSPPNDAYRIGRHLPPYLLRV